MWPLSLSIRSTEGESHRGVGGEPGIVRPDKGVNLGSYGHTEVAFLVKRGTKSKKKCQ